MLLFVDHLTNVDFSFLDERRGLLGETWLANVQLQGDLDDQGMVCDFGIVKKRLRQWLDEELDHRADPGECRALVRAATDPHVSGKQRAAGKLYA